MSMVKLKHDLKSKRVPPFQQVWRNIYLGPRRKRGHRMRLIVQSECDSIVLFEYMCIFGNFWYRTQGSVNE